MSQQKYFLPIFVTIGQEVSELQNPKNGMIFGKPK